MRPFRGTIVCVVLALLAVAQVVDGQQFDPSGPEADEKPELIKRAGPVQNATALGLVLKAQPNVGVPIDGMSARRARIYDALKQDVEFEFVDTPLGEVVGFLKSFAGIPIILDKRALDDVGLSSDTPVTISLHGITLRSALRLTLRDLDLTYVVRDEVLKITTVEEAEQELLTRLYPVPDLAHRDKPGVIMTRPGGRYQLLKQLLTVCVAPESWDEMGGHGNFTPYDPWGFVAITQTEENHEQVEALFATIARARKADPARSAETLAFPIMTEAGLRARAG